MTEVSQPFVPQAIWTLRAIAKRLGVAEEETVLGYAMRERDPLRLVQLFGKYGIRTAKLDAWKARQQPGNTCERINGLHEIAQKLEVSINTVKAYARRPSDPLPINGLGGRRQWAYVDALVDWKMAEARPVRPVQLTAGVAGQRF